MLLLANALYLVSVAWVAQRTAAAQLTALSPIQKRLLRLPGAASPGAATPRVNRSLRVRCDGAHHEPAALVGRAGQRKAICGDFWRVCAVCYVGHACGCSFGPRKSSTLFGSPASPLSPLGLQRSLSNTQMLSPNGQVQHHYGSAHGSQTGVLAATMERLASWGRTNGTLASPSRSLAPLGMASVGDSITSLQPGKYLAACKSPQVSSHGEKQTEIVVAASEIWQKLNVYSDQLDLATERCRQWLARWVLAPVVAEIGRINASLQLHGLAEQVGHATVAKLETIAKVCRFGSRCSAHWLQGHASCAPTLLGLLPYLRGFECQKYYVQRLHGMHS